MPRTRKYSSITYTTSNRKTPFERAIIKYGKILIQLFIFIPVALFVFYTMPENYRGEILTLIIVGILAIITGKILKI